MTGSAYSPAAPRNALRRQQTLRASVDWSHALLTDAERTLFRRLGVFMGGFDLDAAQAVAAISEAEQFQILDQLSLLVDKSLVIADDESGAMRYRLLETCGSTRSKSSASQAKPTRCAIAIATTTSQPAVALEGRRATGRVGRTGNRQYARGARVEYRQSGVRVGAGLGLVAAAAVGRRAAGCSKASPHSMLVFNDERYRDADVATPSGSARLPTRASWRRGPARRPAWSARKRLWPPHANSATTDL